MIVLFVTRKVLFSREVGFVHKIDSFRMTLILKSRASRPHFMEPLHYIDQNSGFKPQKHAMGGSAAQQAPNTIIVTHPESLVGATRRPAKASWFTIPVSGILHFVVPSLLLTTLLQALAPLPLLVYLTDDAHSTLLG